MRHQSFVNKPKIDINVAVIPIKTCNEAVNFHKQIKEYNK